MSDAVERRIAALLAEMTLEEKVAQLQACSYKQFAADKRGHFDEERAIQMFPHGFGALQKGSGILEPRENVAFLNQLQTFLNRKTRLGIPALVHEEVVHGHLAYGATVFPAAIGMAATFDTDLLRRVFSAIAAEASARGGNVGFGPVLDIVTDARWGRCEETYGEDPFLAGELGVAAVEGLQGHDGALGDGKIIASAKHFAGYGSSLGGKNFAPHNVPERDFRDTHLWPFEQAVKRARLMGVMASHGDIDGVPAHGNKKLLRDILQDEWGFMGATISDYSDIARLHLLHKVAETEADAAELALRCGVDMDLPVGQSYRLLVDIIRVKPEIEAIVDQSVIRVLRQKFLLGLFEDFTRDAERAVAICRSPEHQSLALEAAHKSIVLLKNDGVLPLDRNANQRIAVIGPNAVSTPIGIYSPGKVEAVSLLEGVRHKLGAGCNLVSSRGCFITNNDTADFDLELENGAVDAPQLISIEDNEPLMREAVALAADSDLVLLGLGGNTFTSREGFYMEGHNGDRSEIGLPGAQHELYRRLHALGKPIVIVLLHGQPMSIPEINATASAILDGWYLGEVTGTALADVLFGDVNPSGKMPVTIPRSLGQLPCQYRRKPGAALKDYLFVENTPLYPFGYGLSYSRFTYANMSTSAPVMLFGEPFCVSIEVTNESKVAGDAVVQMYLRDAFASVTRPLRELKGFQRVRLQAGETRTIRFPIDNSLLCFTGLENARVVEPGKFTVFIGNDSLADTSAEFTLIDAVCPAPPPAA